MNHPIDQFIDQFIADLAECQYGAGSICGWGFVAAIKAFLCDRFTRDTFDQTGVKAHGDAAISGRVKQLHKLFQSNLQYVIRFCRSGIFDHEFQRVGCDAIPNLLGE